MSFQLRPQSVALACAGLIVLLSSSTAHARRGFFLITTGDAIKHVGDVLPEMRAQVRDGGGRITPARAAYLRCTLTP